MNSQNKFIAKGISLVFFWLIVIAALATLFSCEPNSVCGTITDQYQTINRDIIWVINEKAYEIDYDYAVNCGCVIGDSVCIDLN